MGFHAAEAAHFCWSIKDTRQMSIPWRKKCSPGGCPRDDLVDSARGPKGGDDKPLAPTRIDLNARMVSQ